METNYNVYLLIDPRTKLPFYVGKGKGKRYSQHLKEYEKQIDYFSNLFKYPKLQLSLKHLIFYELSELNLEYEFQVIENLTEEDAYLLEEVLIAWFGRKICGNGILTNLQAGGKDGSLSFDDQNLIEIYQKKELLDIVVKYPKTSTKWIAKTLYFYKESSYEYPFEELSIDWLYEYHQCNQQFALKVIDLLKTYDAVITPFYWVRKINNNPFEKDYLYIMDESFNTILEENNIIRHKSEFEKYINNFQKYVDKT